MAMKIVVADYTSERRAHVVGALREQVAGVEVHELPTDPYDPAKDTNNQKLTIFRTTSYDMLIAHIGGNPSGYDCLRTYKEHNPKGKAILYTKMDAIPLEQFDGLKLANALFKRSDDDTKVFANDSEFIDLIKRVLKEPAVVWWTSPFKDFTVLAALLSFLTALVGLATAMFS